MFHPGSLNVYVYTITKYIGSQNPPWMSCQHIFPFVWWKSFGSEFSFIDSVNIKKKKIAWRYIVFELLVNWESQVAKQFIYYVQQNCKIRIDDWSLSWGKWRSLTGTLGQQCLICIYIYIFLFFCFNGGSNPERPQEIHENTGRTCKQDIESSWMAGWGFEPWAWKHTSIMSRCYDSIVLVCAFSLCASDLFIFAKAILLLAFVIKKQNKTKNVVFGEVLLSCAVTIGL